MFLFQAPAAFGLVSFLLHEGFDRTRIRKHLFIFAAAAPIGAILTYMCLNQVGFLSFSFTLEEKQFYVKGGQL
jgi:zinc transporter 9